MDALAYTVDARDARGHRFRVTLELDLARWPATDRGHELRLPTWTPGSYLIREHARHVSGLTATDAERGTPLRSGKTAKSRFRVEPTAGCRRVRVEYDVYAHELTVRTADLTDEHAFWNGVCLFLRPVGASDAPARVDVLLPDGWLAASPLPSERVDGNRLRLCAADERELWDAPFLAASGLRELEFEALGKRHVFALDGLGDIEPPPSLVADTRKIVEAAAAVFATDLPYDEYRFLCLFTDSGRGGLEHPDCATLLLPRTGLHPRKAYEEALGLVAHEHFHAFNVTRMRPHDLWRLDFETENHTSLLWVAEGFTAYYDDLLCRRAGVLGAERYLGIVANNVTEFRRTPGRLVHPLADASFDAWIKLYRPDENSRNSTQSYYTHGALAAMCLDLEIRRRTGGARSLDDAMQWLWRETYLRDQGYSHADVVQALSTAADADLGPLVAELVQGPLDPDFAALLEPFGIRLTTKPSRRPWLGVQLDEKTMTVTQVLQGGPAMRGGLEPGDEILALQGLRTRPDTWKAVLDNVWSLERPLDLWLSRRGRLLQRRIPALPDPHPAVRLELATEATAAQLELRRGWLGQ